MNNTTTIKILLSLPGANACDVLLLADFNRYVLPGTIELSDGDLLHAAIHQFDAKVIGIARRRGVDDRFVLS